MSEQKVTNGIYKEPACAFCEGKGMMPFAYCARCFMPMGMNHLNICPHNDAPDSAYDRGHAQGVSSQQARIDKLTKETWDLGTERDELKVRIRELEAELEARKKAWEGLKHSCEIHVLRDHPLDAKYLLESLTALEATLPKGGA